MWIFKEAMEAAGSADRRRVAEAMRKMDTSEGAAKYYPGGRLRFDEKGRRIGAETVILQWRNGTPVPVYPPGLAVMAPLQPKRRMKTRENTKLPVSKTYGIVFENRCFVSNF